MVRVVVLAFLATAGAAFSLSEPVLAKGMRGGGAPGFRGVVHMPRFHFRPSPRAYGTIRPSAPYGTVKPAAPYGTVKPFAPYGTVKALTSHGVLSHAPAYGALATAPAPKPKFARRHHGAYYTGWSFPVTYVGEEPVYIGIPYDPSEAIPVYGPETSEADEPVAPRLSSVRRENADPCGSERVTVPAAEGEREITIIRCSQ
jgi:hypothetical protein